ncbi:MAG TPA: endolytic transglycosylase MltG [Burkholderiaceae bacterium]|nr:endolytic transglycosylase MltG [Burkholderiaceae bacterium]
MSLSKTLLLLAALAIVAALGLGWHMLERAVPMPEGAVRVIVPKGANVRTVAAQLRQQGIEVSPQLLLLRYRMRGLDGQLKAGTYEFAAPQTIDTLLDKIALGDTVVASVRFIEGWTFRQMRAVIDAHPELASDSAGLSDAEIMKRIGSERNEPEGLFMPDTYTFSPGVSDLEIYRQAYRALERQLTEAWQRRAADLPLTSPYDALILASIVEKETGRPEDRAQVAGVFVNRLRIGMMLQSDPTTIYGLGERFDGNLRRGDLRADTPYNTYTRKGLPPTPIALVSAASLEAALNPADTKALYFVARGDGSSQFSNTLAEHNRAVARYQLGRK